MDQEHLLRGIVKLLNAGMGSPALATAAGVAHHVVLGALADEPLTDTEQRKLARALRRYGAL